MGMIEIERRPDGIAVVVLDHPTKPVNTLSPAVVEEFNEKVAPLLDDDAIRGMVVVSAKPDTFIAGADLELIEGLSETEISDMSREGNALLERIFTSPKPVVAAVHGRDGGRRRRLADPRAQAAEDAQVGILADFPEAPGDQLALDGSVDPPLQ